MLILLSCFTPPLSPFSPPFHSVKALTLRHVDNCQSYSGLRRKLRILTKKRMTLHNVIRTSGADSQLHSLVHSMSWLGLGWKVRQSGPGPQQENTLEITPCPGDCLGADRIHGVASCFVSTTTTWLPGHGHTQGSVHECSCLYGIFWLRDGKVH